MSLMVRRLIEWALNNPLVVILLTVALATFGVFAFLNVNVEAYPDPVPPLDPADAQWADALLREKGRR